MTSLAWRLITTDPVVWAVMLVKVLAVMLFMCWDHPLLLYWRAFQRLLGKSHEVPKGVAHSLLVVVPSLLRKRDELTSMMSTVRSILTNGYPGPLTLVVTIDGCADAPELFDELTQWARTVETGPGCRFHVTGTEVRRSKPMAIEHAMGFVKDLVASGELPAFPPVYVSTDADADLGEAALERIVYRLQQRNRWTGWPARAVAGALHVRGDDFWKGWRAFFTMEGQLTLQVAREYYVGNVWRYNLRWMPVVGVPGAFYCTWSDVFLGIPGLLGHLRTLRRRDWYRWWLGARPPAIGERLHSPLPELMAGDTDDTVTAYAATIVRHVDGRFRYELPRTPLHAFADAIRTLFIDRPIQFEPGARVFTSSPATLTALFKQRRRWNASRVELTGRFWPALGYFWGLAMPVAVVKVFLARGILVGLAGLLLAPFLIWKARFLDGLLIGYALNILVYGLFTASTLLMNAEAKYLRLLLAVPLAPLYQFAVNWVAGTYGVTSDVLLLGNKTGFAPEQTLIKGGSTRIALLFRLRRWVLVSLRALVVGDVPFGAFWFGWRETKWTPSGFEGWSTGRRRRILPPIREWFARRSPADVAPGIVGASVHHLSGRTRKTATESRATGGVSEATVVSMQAWIRSKRRVLAPTRDSDSDGDATEAEPNDPGTTRHGP